MTMMRRFIALLLFALLPLAAAAQVTTFNTKPIASIWSPADISSVELRIRGRLSTDPLTAHRIIKRYPIKGLDWVKLTVSRITVDVPLNETWEIKSLQLFVVPFPKTGLASVELTTLTLPVFHAAPPGRPLPIEVGLVSGVVTLGMSVTAPLPPLPPPAPPPPPAPAGNKMPPATSLVDAQGATWTLRAQSIAGENAWACLRNGVKADHCSALCKSADGFIYGQDNINGGGRWQRWLNPGWSAHGPTPTGC